jgi:small-conductance mechanosensitive channel
MTITRVWNWFSGAPLHILAIILIALISQKVGGRAIERGVGRLGEADLVPGPKRNLNRQKERAKTAASLLRSTATGTIWLVAGTMVLSELGLNLGPIVASAGVLGVALGLGAQTLVRDLLSGIFMLVEDQYGVGDEIDVLDVKGAVESVGLRITTVRSPDGTLWYLRNGEILKVGNKSQSKH